MATTGEMHKGWRGVRGDLGKDAIVSAAKGNNSHKHKTIENFYFVLKKKICQFLTSHHLNGEWRKAERGVFGGPRFF